MNDIPRVMGLPPGTASARGRRIPRRGRRALVAFACVLVALAATVPAAAQGGHRVTGAVTSAGDGAVP